MNPRAPLDPRLLEALSAYLDGKLTGAELAGLEEQLKRDEALRRQLSELRAVRDSLRSLPVLKPPRPLTLSPAQAQAGKPAISPWSRLFSSRTLALGSALASLAFVVIAGMDIFSRGFLMAASTRSALLENLALPAAFQPQDQSVGGSAAMPTPPKAQQPTTKSVAHLTYEPPEKTGNGEAGEATHMPAATASAAADKCGDQPVADTVQEGCGLPTGLAPSPTPKPFTLPDFRDAAPYLEVLLGLSAVLLGALALIIRRRRK